MSLYTTRRCTKNKAIKNTLVRVEIAEGVTNVGHFRPLHDENDVAHWYRGISARKHYLTGSLSVSSGVRQRHRIQLFQSFKTPIAPRTDFWYVNNCGYVPTRGK